MGLKRKASELSFVLSSSSNKNVLGPVLFDWFCNPENGTDLKDNAELRSAAFEETVLKLFELDGVLAKKHAGTFHSSIYKEGTISGVKVIAVGGYSPSGTGYMVFKLVLSPESWRMIYCFDTSESRQQVPMWQTMDNPHKNQRDALSRLLASLHEDSYPHVPDPGFFSKEKSISLWKSEALPIPKTWSGFSQERDLQLLGAQTFKDLAQHLGQKASVKVAGSVFHRSPGPDEFLLEEPVFEFKLQNELICFALSTEGFTFGQADHLFIKQAFVEKLKHLPGLKEVNYSETMKYVPATLKALQQVNPDLQHYTVPSGISSLIPLYL